MSAPTSYDGTTFYVPTPAAVAAAQYGTGGSGATHAWKDGGSFSFHDVLDALNPLQHIPVVSTIYRWITGDEPGNVARIVGDTLYGGPIGTASGALSIAFKEETGKDPGEMAVALLTGGDTGSAQVRLGSATPAATQPPAAAAPATTAGAAPGTTASPAAAAPTATAPAAAPAAVTAATVTAGAPLMAGRRPLMPLFASPGAATQPARPITAPVPLQLTGPQLPQRFPRYGAAPATPAGVTAPAPPAAAAPPAAPAIDLSALPQNPPVDIPQRMLEALDKYAHIQQQRGQQVDVSP